MTEPRFSSSPAHDPPVRDTAYWIARHERRRARRRVSGVRALRKVRADGGYCRLCQTTEAERRADRTLARPDRYRITKHHMVPQADGGRNDPANIVGLCRACHDLIDKMPLWRRIPQRAELRRLLDPEEIAYVRAVKGQEWLDYHYPLDPNAWIGATPPAEGAES